VCRALFATGVFVYGATGSSGALAESESSWRDRFDARAVIELEWAQGIANGKTQKLEAIVQPQVEVDLTDKSKLVAIGRLRGDAFDRLEPGFPSQDEVSPWSRRLLFADQAEAELREFYLKTQLGSTYLTLGKQQVVWGQADGLKVLDVVNPQSFREFILDDFDDSRIPLWTVNTEVTLAKDTTLQLLWIPDTTAHDLPDPGSPFAFTAPFLVPEVPPGVDVDLRPTDRPARMLADSDVGARLSAFVKGWDLTLNYLYHYDDIPVLYQQLGLSATGPTVIVQPRYERTHLIGGTASNAFGDLTVRAEVGYSTDRFFITDLRRDPSGVASSPELSYVIGMDWFGFRESLISFQLFQSLVIDDPPGLVRDSVDTTTTLLLRREFLNDTVVAEVMWLQGINDGDGLVRPKVSYAVQENLKVWLGADIFYGKRESLFGEFNDNDRVVVGLEWGI
jgi:hypothetical protein